jgi:asparagine synthase (glutamine-hydrolysing)
MSRFEAYAPQIPEIPKNIDIAARILRELLFEAMEKRMQGSEAVSLSGGLDSSIIAAIAKQFNPNINLFTVSVESKPGPDLENAKLMRSFLDLEHIIYTISDTDIENVIADCVWYLESFDEDYDEFLDKFPPSYETQTIRWDPFK